MADRDVPHHPSLVLSYLARCSSTSSRSSRTTSCLSQKVRPPVVTLYAHDADATPAPPTLRAEFQSQTSPLLPADLVQVYLFLVAAKKAGRNFFAFYNCACATPPPLVTPQRAHRPSLITHHRAIASCMQAAT